MLPASELEGSGEQFKQARVVKTNTDGSKSIRRDEFGTNEVLLYGRLQTNQLP